MGLVGRPEGKGLLQSSRRRWNNGIKKYLKIIWYEGMDWIQLNKDNLQ
jgi:hypothetical protein